MLLAEESVKSKAAKLRAVVFYPALLYLDGAGYSSDTPQYRNFPLWRQFFKQCGTQ